MNLADYKEDVVVMVNAFHSTYNKIKSKDDKGFSNPESALFDALLMTKNKDFKDSINSIVREWEQEPIMLMKRSKNKRSSCIETWLLVTKNLIKNG